MAVLNADWVIANRGLLWDLNVWPDDISNDAPDAPRAGLDYEMLNALMLASYNMLQGKKLIQVAGFVPWAFKYITDTHGGVATEWQAVKILSAYNAYIDADACCNLNTFANSAFYQHYPLQGSYQQRPAPTVESLKAQGYVDAHNKVANYNFIRYWNTVFMMWCCKVYS